MFHKPIANEDQVPKARGTGRSGPRRRTGCLTCRARKVRCDEAKPTCANCTRLRLQCIYKTIVPGTTSRRSIQRIPQVPQQTFTIDPAPTHVPDRLDVNYFDTVLQPRELRPRRASHILPHQVVDHTLPPTSVSVPDFPSFDMLGFIGEITSDFEQKHLDLTNGVSAFTLTSEALSPTTPGHVGGSNQIVQQPTWTVDTSPETLPSPSDSQSDGVQNVLSGDRSIWPETRQTYEERLLSHFAEIDPPPTTFGSIALEWNYVRNVIISHSGDTSCLLNALYCYSDIHKSMGEGKRWRAAPVYHRQASSEIQSCVTESMDDSLLKRTLTAVFLLILSELVSLPDLGDSSTSFLHSAYLLLQRFHHRTRLWTGFGHLIVSWVSLLDVRALIAGRDGDPLVELGMLDQIGTAEMDQRPEDELLSQPGYLIHNAITGPAYSFLFKAQQVIRRIVCLDMHHRRRGTVSDEFEVLQVAHQIGADLEALWNKRPRVLDVYDKPEELYNTLQPAVADEVCRTFRQYIANFLAIFIYLHRVAFVIYPRTDRVHRAVGQIIQLATVESSSENHHLPISFTWPLFVAGLEGSLEQRGWIIQEMQRMADLPSDHSPVAQRHPNAKKILQLLEEMTKRQDASRTWADSRLVRRELFVDPFVLI
ncbi:fungal-specific transcription factor domain-containing protein [Aspergillus pseudocaelatus]|uniref:Fungal-specific transcription factor domain-containing protein n=1 Tax=Aspergillus pseudocaelatus TaxID=1825620 RepID=A0ABQ6W5R1_9EURO|nr:fungal-specific transcription factor domain-containing protein [Aspergillus pseudocaelatus]